MNRRITLSCLSVFLSVCFSQSRVVLQPCPEQIGYSPFTFLPDKASFHFRNTTGITENDFNSLATIFLKAKNSL